MNIELYNLLLNLRYISNSDFEEKEIEDFVKLFIANNVFPNLSFPNSASIIESDLKRMRETTRIILNSIIKGVDTTIKNIDKSQIAIVDIDNFRKKYPYYVKLNTPQKALLFFDKLDKEHYNYSEAAKLLNLSRQTISTYVNDNLNGFKQFEGGKKIVTKEQIYNYYIKYLHPEEA